MKAAWSTGYCIEYAWWASKATPWRAPSCLDAMLGATQWASSRINPCLRAWGPSVEMGGQVPLDRFSGERAAARSR